MNGGPGTPDGLGGDPLKFGVAVVREYPTTDGVSILDRPTIGVFNATL